MYFKVMKDKEIIDLLDHISYVKYQEKHDQILLCDMKEAEAILSSNGKYGWHIEGLYHFQPDNYVYRIEQITKFNYDRLKKALEMGE